MLQLVQHVHRTNKYIHVVYFSDPTMRRISHNSLKFIMHQLYTHETDQVGLQVKPIAIYQSMLINITLGTYSSAEQQGQLHQKHFFLQMLNAICYRRTKAIRS